MLGIWHIYVYIYIYIFIYIYIYIYSGGDQNPAWAIPPVLRMAVDTWLLRHFADRWPGLKDAGARRAGP